MTTSTATTTSNSMEDTTSTTAGGAPPSRQQSLPPPSLSSRQSSYRSPRPRRSGSTTPAASNAVNHHLPSRSNSPSRLRSLPSVGISNAEALSDAIARIVVVDGQIARDAAVAEGLNASSSNPTSPLIIDGGTVNDHLLLAGLAGGGGDEGEGQSEDYAKDKEVILPSPRSTMKCKFAEELLIESGISDYTFIPLNQGGLLGRGKFSSVQLAWKNNIKYAVKITPLYPHHNLIATRLLREPTILAQLPLHPNLVKVYESIRTPGHFYLVEEYLDGYTNLENFVAAQPGGKLNLSQATHIYYQLVSVVRSALHKPIQIAHRDIKPENILIHPTTLRIILLDFGLATHFSSREARLTTCCGSPAFHAPELVLSLKSSPGSIRYWGPEVDVWTIGVTLLRCLTGVKYPLGVQHTSLQHLADKTIDAILSIKDKEFKNILAGLLDMDGIKRMDFFTRLPSSIDEIPYKTLNTDDNHHDALIVAAGGSGSNPSPSSSSNLATVSSSQAAPQIDRTFKNTTFIETEMKHSLSLILRTPSSSTSELQDLISTTTEYGGGGRMSFLRSRSQSRDRLSSLTSTVPGLELSVVDERLTANHPISNGKSSTLSKEPSTSTSTSPSSSIPQLILLNPNGEPAMRAISYVKYALRCAGILYHCQEPSEDLSIDKPSSHPPKQDTEYPILHCIRVVPKSMTKNSPAASLLSQLRPPLSRAVTAGNPRSSSTPPSRAKTGKASDEEKDVRCLEFWLQIMPVFTRMERSPKQSTSHFFRNSNQNSAERSSSQQRKRPKSKSRATSLANIHESTSNSTSSSSSTTHRRCTKLILRVSDESVIDVLRKVLQGSGNSETLDNYALYATPPPPRYARLHGMSKNHSGEENEKAKHQSKEEDPDQEEDRGRPKLSRSKSSDSRSPPRPKPQRAHTSKPSVPAGGAQHHQHREHQQSNDGQKRQHNNNNNPNVNGQNETAKHLSPPTPLKDDQIVNGIHEVRLDKDEVKKIQQSKRGFFDFVTFSKRSSSPKPTVSVTAPTSPASITEDDDSPPLTTMKNNRNEQHNVTFAAM